VGIDRLCGFPVLFVLVLFVVVFFAGFFLVAAGLGFIGGGCAVFDARFR
jgi:hypothetical protein